MGDFIREAKKIENRHLSKKVNYLTDLKKC